MNENKTSPWLRDIYSGLLGMATSATKAPALIYALSKSQPINLGARAASKEKLIIPKALYDNKVIRYMEEATNNQSYVNERWHSKGDNLTTVIKRKDPAEITSYLAHNVLANAPQQLALVAATIFGGGTPALIGLASLSASDSYSQGIKSGVSHEKALVNAIVNGTAEAAFERVGTVGVVKSLKNTLVKQLGKKAADKTLKNVYKRVALEALKAGGQEGLEEAATSVVQDVSANITGVQKDELRDIINNSFESATIGALSGASMSAPVTSISVAMNSAREKKRIQEYKDTVEAKGGVFVGVQEGTVEEDGNVIPSSVLFKDSTGKEYSLKETDFDSYLVGKKLGKNIDNVEPKKEPTITYVKNLKSKTGRELSAGYKDGVIYINKEKAKKDFSTQEWTKPKIEDVDPLPVDHFNNINEWVEFLVEHEKAHHTTKRVKDESIGSYENRINKTALNVIEEKKASSKFENVTLDWLTDSDTNEYTAQDTVISLQRVLMKRLGQVKYTEQVRDYDKAIHRYIDLKNNPNALNKNAFAVYSKYVNGLLIGKKITQEQAQELLDSHQDYKDKTVFNALSKEEQRLYTLAQNLPDNVKEIADFVQEEYANKYTDLKGNRPVGWHPNFVRRKYESLNPIGKFVATDTKKTKTELHRSFETMAEAFISDFTLIRDGATTNLQSYLKEVNDSVANTNFIKSLIKLDNGTFISTKPRMGYNIINNPTFTTKDGQPMFAPTKAAELINNMFDESKLKDIPLWKTASKYNAVLKAWKLTSSLFHFTAFTNSYIFGVHKNWNWKDWNPWEAHIAGLKAIKDSGPVINLLRSEGLTLGRIQDWNEQSLRQKTLIGEWLDKNGASKLAKDSLVKLREELSDFLFSKYGAGLKAKSAIIEFRNHMERNPEMDPRLAAREVADLINDDFGGLHHKRMGRNQTVQDILRFVFLGSDWTESNVRLMLKSFNAGSDTKTKLYRHFWAGAISKYAIAWVLFNLLGGALTRDDDEEKGILAKSIRNYVQAWEDGKLNHMRVSLDPYLDFMGIPHKDRYYHNIWGHFLDPVKWFTRDIKKGDSLTGATKQLLDPSRVTTGLLKSAYYKSAQLPQAALNALMGTDYTFARKYNTLSEAIETGKLKDWRQYGENMRPIKAGEIPAYLVHESGRIVPIPIMTLFKFMFGEIEGIEAIATILGQDVKQAYSKQYKRYLRSK